ncbi:MAG: hypothetical protein QGG14_02685 [Planctomycetota bacterium]|jgi:hypothetical protein|nr:hypothetical protein [Planctomycetota bacterium]
MERDQILATVEAFDAASDGAFGRSQARITGLLRSIARACSRTLTAGHTLKQQH